MVAHVYRFRLKNVLLIVMLLFGFGCEMDPQPDSALDCGREFIMATYNGNFKKARKLIVANAGNNDILYNQYEIPFRNKDGFAKQELSETPLVVKDMHTNKEGNLIIVFDNAIAQKPDSILVVIVAENWRVSLDKK